MAERQRVEREAQRVQHFALLGRLAAGVSHEIRNPLGAIFLHVDLLEEELRQPSAESAGEIAQAFTEIKAQLARLDELVQDYLSLVRVGMAQLVPEDLRTFVTQCAQEMTSTLAAHGITLQLDAPAPLGMVALHKNTFRRVLLNLVQNAIEAMPQGGTLTLRGRRQAATVQLDISDTGIGIPLEHYTRFLSRCIRRNRGAPGWDLYRAGGGGRAWRAGRHAEYGRRRHHLYDHAAPRWDVRETVGKGNGREVLRATRCGPL